MNFAKCILILTATLSFRPARAELGHFDPTLVANISKRGPNCYFAALTVNSLLNVPAITFSENAAAILFNNPALCDEVTEPKLGDIGVVEAMGILGHVYTYISPSRRFEKSGPTADEPYEFVDTASTATKFVRCHPMQDWVNGAVKTLSPELQALDLQISEIESLMDVRNGPKSAEKLARAKAIFDHLTETNSSMYQILKAELASRGVDDVPFPGMVSPGYYRFSKNYPKMISSPKIFALMWLSARLEKVDEEIIYYNY